MVIAATVHTRAFAMDRARASATTMTISHGDSPSSDCNIGDSTSVEPAMAPARGQY
jgi:hypothetical protein